MNWQAMKVKERATLVAIQTKNLHENVREEDYADFASALAFKVKARLRRVGYRKVDFKGRATQEAKLWGAAPDEWTILVQTAGGLWQYHAQTLVKHIVDESNKLLQLMSVRYAAKDAADQQASSALEAQAKVEAEKSRIILPGAP